jgi:hypothetical protein
MISKTLELCGEPDIPKTVKNGPFLFVLKVGTGFAFYMRVT